MSEPLFLGLDLSTQSLKSTVSTATGTVLAEKTINFHRDLPQYGTTNGAIAGSEDGEMTTPVALWIESLDIVMNALKDAGVNLGAIAGVSGAAQVRARHSPRMLMWFVLTYTLCSNMEVSTGPKPLFLSSKIWIPSSPCSTNSCLPLSPYPMPQSGKTRPLPPNVVSSKRPLGAPRRWPTLRGVELTSDSLPVR